MVNVMYFFQKHEKSLIFKGLNAPSALPRICSAYAHSARSAFGALSLLQAKKANELGNEDKNN